MKNNIKKLRDGLGWSQDRLAREAGTSGPQINRLEKSQRRLTQEWMMKIGDALGCHPSDLLPAHKIPAETPTHHRALQENTSAETVPVLGHKNGATRDAIVIDARQEAGRAPMHPLQTGMRKAFAFYVRGESMAPRYRPGELVWVAPNRTPAEGQDCLVELAGGESFLRQFMRESGEQMIFRQLNPAKDWKRGTAEIKALHPVVGRG